MRRFTEWVGGAVSGIALYRLAERLRRRQPEVADGPSDTRAEELREKLAESREAEPAPEPAAAETLDERRQRVHEHGRAAIDEMRPE